MSALVVIYKVLDILAHKNSRPLLCVEKSGTNYLLTLRQIPEEEIHHPYGRGNLKTPKLKMSDITSNVLLSFLFISAVIQVIRISLRSVWIPNIKFLLRQFCTLMKKYNSV
jgi:hypothetical protein